MTGSTTSTSPKASSNAWNGRERSRLREGHPGDHRGTVAAGGVEELLWPEQSFAICLPTSGFASLPPTHLRPRQQVITSPRAAYEQLLIVGIVPIHLVFGEDAVDVLPFLREYSVQYHRQKRWFMK